ncbi:MAG TPA: tripartite tricarboxylate transporter TctB family protein [Afifellaceae bacterium]|nr:tripartite tricarboxylate transporter TctB family protein [Afifellaceae bacterium]
MSHDNPAAAPGDGQRQKRHVLGELLIPVAGLIFTAYYFSTIMHSPWTAQVSAFFVGTILSILSLIFLFKTAIGLRRGWSDLKIGPIAEPAGLTGTRLILLALTIGYIFIIQFTGFTLTTFVFMAAAMSLLARGRRIGFIIVLSAVVSVAGWGLFVYAFKTRFPLGPFERLMDYLV